MTAGGEVDNNGGNNADQRAVRIKQAEQQALQHEPPSLTIPITSSPSCDPNFIEIFPEELKEIPSSTLLQVLIDEASDLNVWADVGLAYMQQSLAGESSAILQAACDRPGGNFKDRVRLLASAGIANLALGNTQEERGQADQRFTNASKVDTFFPMTWMGKGSLNFSANRLDQAKFFFDTTLKQCGQVLPGLLGMASVLYREKNFAGAQSLYATALRKYPHEGGPALRVGFGLASYRLGQVDKAKAAFQRALDMDPEHVPAMVGAALLDMASLDVTQPDFRTRTEKAIKMISMANLLDHSNAMVQNHLANHYFWKWTPLAGSVQVTQGSKIVKASQPTPLDPGERIRIGMEFTSIVVEVDDDENTQFTIKDTWKGETTAGLKLWKKDYDRVSALAKGAYNSTSVKEIQAESLFLLARVHHARDDVESAQKLYEKACKFAPDLTPARFGLAQTLIAQDEVDSATAHLKLVLGTSATATDALALLGLLQVKSGQKKDGLLHLKKAIDLDPLNPDLIVLEALALQQQKSDYPKSLEKYRKAIKLLEKKEQAIPHQLLCNIGVLCHETKSYQEALDMYKRALDALGSDQVATLDNEGIEGGRIRHKDNEMFFGFVDSTCRVKAPSQEGSDILDLEEETATNHILKKGDHVRIGDEFVTEIEDINEEGGKVSLKLKVPFVPPPLQSSADDAMAEGKEEEKENPSPPSSYTVFLKRENKVLDEPQAITIAFNIARVHENSGRTVAAVELLKAIIKRVPTYVNCYLRLACIARDSGFLKECSSWLKIACQAQPGNPEVLTLVGNLHLSLCDWGPAQRVFDQLLMKRVSSVEAYSKLSLGNIYFANLNQPKNYSKHLTKASDLYKSILTKDKANAYAANGIGTILAEKADLYKAKEVFNRVREVSGDTIADAHLNLGHIYLAQKKHPEALQMYQTYMKKTQDGTAPITTKSREDDEAEVLLYIAFAYFDWARQTEEHNNAQAAPADGRYKKCIEHLELALQKSRRKEVLLRYNLCMTKLQAANCVLQKLTRNIRRTAQEVQDALTGLEESLVKVEEIRTWKKEGKKIHISMQMLNEFIENCKANIESAKSHLEEENRREAEANEMRELQRVSAESKKQEEAIRVLMKKEQEARRQEARDRKAAAKMEVVARLQQGWIREAAAAKRDKKEKNIHKAPEVVGDNLFDDDDDNNDNIQNNNAAKVAALFDSSDDEDNAASKPSANVADSSEPMRTEKELFGADSDSDEESDEELIPTEKTAGTKRTNEEISDEQPETNDNNDDDNIVNNDNDGGAAAGDGGDADDTAAGGGDADGDGGEPAPKRSRLFDEEDDE